MELIAYLGDAKLKEDLQREITKHEEADAIVQGTYGKQNGIWKGCAVACSLRSLAIVKGEPLLKTYDSHLRYETDLGIPRIIARLEDKIFEGLSTEEAKKFPRQFAEAINTGANLSLVWPKFVVWLLIDEKDGMIQYAKNDRQREVIANVANLYNKVIDGEKISQETWKSVTAADAYADAAAAAYAADYAADAAAAYDAATAAYAADYAADAAAAYAAAAADYAAAADAYADTAADYAADAYAYATTAAAYAADAADVAAADAREIHYSKCAEKLIEILKATK